MPGLFGGSVTSSFQHAAVFYRDLDELVAEVTPFVRDGVVRGEPVLVAELPLHVRALEESLGTDAEAVTFLDMTELGGNPARIIPAWRDFVAAHPGRPVRGVGEPAWPGRRRAELEECRLHEALLNVAFDSGPEFQLLCPYDASALANDVLLGAMQTHPVVGGLNREKGYGGHDHAQEEFMRSLGAPPADAERIPFGALDLTGLRSVVRRVCEAARATGDVTDDLVLAVHELASNSIEHGGGRGTFRSWVEPDCLVLEVSDEGVIADPLVGREPATGLAEAGRGIWMANQLCDLLQVRSSAAGTTVRLHAWS